METTLNFTNLTCKQNIVIIYNTCYYKGGKNVNTIDKKQVLRAVCVLVVGMGSNEIFQFWL